MKKYVKLFESWINEEDQAINLESLTIAEFKKKDVNTQKNILQSIFDQFKYDKVKLDVSTSENSIRLDFSSAGGTIYVTPTYDDVSENSSIFELPFEIQLASTGDNPVAKVNLILYFDWLNNKMKKPIGSYLYSVSKPNSSSDLSINAFNGDDSIGDKNAGYGQQAEKYFSQNKSRIVSGSTSLAGLANKAFEMD